jgi:reprolysin-like metallo-peptidase family M12B
MPGSAKRVAGGAPANTGGTVRRTMIGLCLAVAAALTAPGAALAQSDVWDPIAGTPPDTRQGAPAEIEADHLLAFTLDRQALDQRLDDAPQVGLRARALTRPDAVTLSLPAPNGTFQRFEVQEIPVMHPDLAAQHPQIKTYAGRGIDDPAATVRADSTPLGFHASVRSSRGAWYIDPYYHLDDSVYVSYYGRDLVADPDGSFVERGPEEETDPLGLGALDVPVGPEIKLRTYRLALLTDPTYSTYFGGPQNVTAAKVTLMNRVDQIYEDETGIRMILIADNDKLNLNTAADMTGANGPCGAAACYTAAQSVTCGSATLNRTRIVIGQIIGAANFDIGHIALGNPGGGIASLGVVGGNGKAQGCTGLPTPVGDFFAVDYVAHEMGHQFAGNHTFNGTQSNCGPGNRSPIASVEPGSGSSIMAYAGICQQDNLQPHSDPYWSERSYDEITTYTSSDRPPINEVQTASLRDFDGTDAFTITWNGNTTAPIVRGTSYTLANIQRELQGPSEVQTVALADNQAGDSYTLSYNGGETVPIVSGQNDTAAGIQNAIQGGNEQQQVSLAGFNSTTQSFQIQIGGNTSVTIGAGGVPLTNGNVTTAVNAIPGFAGTAQSSGAGNTGFTLTFGGASANIDVPPIAIVNCTGACAATVRETAKGGDPMPGWPAGGTVVAGGVTATGYTLTLSGTLQGTDVDPFAITNANGLTGSVAETVKGAPGILPPHATGVVAGWGGAQTLDDTGFQVTFGAGLGAADQPSISVDVTGGSAFVGETAQGGPIENQGFIVTDTGNHAPVVTTAPAFTIPLRTPFALTGSATDSDGDPLTYMWEQNDRGGATGTALVSNVKRDGPLFRQFGTAANVSASDTLLTPSPGLNAVDDNPRRLFPDIAQILAGNTNAVTGACPAAPPAPTAVPPEIRDCFSEFLPTADWVGLPGDRTLNFRLTARDAKLGGGGIGGATTKLTLAPSAGPFLVTSQGAAATLRGGSQQTVTWDVAGTDVAPIGATEVKISLTSGQVLAAATANDGSATVTLPNAVATGVRIKIEAVGNVFFDLSDADLAIQAAPDVVANNPTVQYSDAVTGTIVKASDEDSAGTALTATATGLPAGLALAEDTTTEHTRTWTLAGNVTAAPGTYAGSVSVTDGDGEAVTAPLTVTVKAEDADVAYTGETLTSGSTVLRATIADSADGAPGDLAHATVTFKEGAATLCGPLPGASGVVSCRVTLPPGAHAIAAVAGDYYTGSATKTVKVVKPGSAVVLAASSTKVKSSSGTYKPDVGAPLTFAFDAAYKKTTPKGLAEIAYLHNGRIYRISADRFESLASDNGRAEFRATADIWDHSRLLWPARVARDATLHVTLTKHTVAISVWDGDTLLFSLPEHTLSGGVVLIK